VPAVLAGVHETAEGQLLDVAQAMDPLRLRFHAAGAGLREILLIEVIHDLCTPKNPSSNSGKHGDSPKSVGCRAATLISAQD